MHENVGKGCSVLIERKLQCARILWFIISSYPTNLSLEKLEIKFNLSDNCDKNFKYVMRIDF